MVTENSLIILLVVKMIPSGCIFDIPVTWSRLQYVVEKVKKIKCHWHKYMMHRYNLNSIVRDRCNISLSHSPSRILWLILSRQLINKVTYLMLSVTSTKAKTHLCCARRSISLYEVTYDFLLWIVNSNWKPATTFSSNYIHKTNSKLYLNDIYIITSFHIICCCIINVEKQTLSISITVLQLKYLKRSI